MRTSTVVIELAGNASLARDLAAGGVFVPGCTLGITEECELVVCCAGRRVSLPARVVYVDGQRGAGLELIGFSIAMREQLAELAVIAGADGAGGMSGEPARSRADGEPREARPTDASSVSARDALSVPVAIGADDDQRTVPVSRAAPSAGPADDDLAVPVAMDTDDDHRTVPVVRAAVAGLVPPISRKVAGGGLAQLPPSHGHAIASDPVTAISGIGAPPLDSAYPDAELATGDTEAVSFSAASSKDDVIAGDAATGPSEVGRAEHVDRYPAEAGSGDGHAASFEAGAETGAYEGDGASDWDETGGEPDGVHGHDPGDPSERRGAELRIPRNVHERLRGLSLAAQIKLATSGELHERIVLERLYGKNVWEPLLHNPRLTAPEVSRIARYGSLPRVLLELIVGNNAWLQVPEVRRALLSNPRLAAEQIMKVLRLVPKHELRLAAIQTAYPHAVRNAARMLLRDE